MPQTLCFFAKVREKKILERVEFYARDIQALKDLGFDVRIAITPAQLRPADVYFAWWWTWAFFPLSLARMLGRPIVISGIVSDLTPFDARSYLHRKLVRYALKHADANIFTSQMEYQGIPERFDVRRPYYSPLTVDTQRYRPNGDIREDLILSVGWLEGDNAVRKGMPDLIEAAPRIHQRHPDVRFVIAGEKGSYYPVLQQKVRELGAESYVEFPGAISVEQKIELMQRCKVYLQPTRFEGFGLAILEAMSCGAPVVTSPGGAVPEVVGDAAVLVDGRSPESVATAVNKLLDEPSLRRNLGERARSRAETQFPYERRKRELKEILDGVLSSR